MIYFAAAIGLVMGSFLLQAVRQARARMQRVPVRIPCRSPRRR